MNREQQIEQAGKIYCKDCVALKFPSCMGNLKRTDILAAYRNGAEWADKTMIEHIEQLLLSEVLPSFMHGGEADEVVAMLDEKLNHQGKEGV